MADGEEQFNFEKVADEMYSSLKIKDRSYYFKTYKKTFLGTDAVDFLVNKGYAQSREDAVDIGRMMVHAHIFHHCVRDHDFEDQKLFYRFQRDEDAGEQGKSADGKSMSWASFLSTPAISGEIGLQASQFDLDPDTDMVDALFEVSPLDKYNQELLNNAHPPAWANPKKPPKIYDLVAIGAGTGGLAASRIAAIVGGKAALIEAHLFGGDCLNHGCVPSKALLKSAHTIYDMKMHAEESGITFEGVRIDFAKIMERMRKVRARISHDDTPERNVKEYGVDCYVGKAIFTAENKLRVGEQEIQFAKCVVASGGKPTVPRIAGLQDVKYMTNLTFFNQTTLPKRLAVIGSGPIGSEMAQAMSLFGSEVTLLNRSDRILGKEDPEAAAIVRKSMEKCGMKIVTGLSFEKVYYTDENSEADANGDRPITVEVVKDGETMKFEVDRLLVATGRKPNVNGFGLDVAGVEYDERKGILVDDKLMTSNKRIYAVGDCCTRYQFTHVALEMGKIAVYNALFGKGEKFSNVIIPWATFTIPEVSHVGLYEKDLNDNNIPFDVHRTELHENDRAICESSDEGFVKILCKKGTDKILGATIVADNAGDLINEITMMMTQNLGLEKLTDVIHPYPTVGEAIRAVGNDYAIKALSPMKKSLLRMIIAARRS